MLPEFEAFLNDISTCFIDRQLHVWRSRLILPFTVVTRDGPVVLEDGMAVAANFNHYLTAFDVMQLDLIDRRTISLEDCGDGTWLGTFETRLLSHQKLAVAPYTATALLQVVDRKFRMSSLLNGRGHHEWTGVRGA